MGRFRLLLRRKKKVRAIKNIVKIVAEWKIYDTISVYTSRQEVGSMDCMVTLHELLDSFSPSERRVAEYFLDQREQVIGQPIDEVAQACQTSKTTVVRLCKLAGFHGYKEFCIALSTSLAVSSTGAHVYEDVDPGGDLKSIAQQVSKRNISAIQNTMGAIELDTLKQVVHLLHEANRIDFYGQGSSGIVAMDAQSKFMRIGKYAVSSIDPHVQVVSAATLKKGDVAVLFSYSGETKDILQTCDVCKESGAATIALTRYAPNALAERADIRLAVASVEPDVRSGAMASRTAMLNVVDVLFSAVTALEYNAARPSLDRSLHAAMIKKGK